MSLQTPLGRARGLGSAKEGVGHWWAQRVTAVALLPLALWFVASVISLAGASYAEAQLFLSSTCNATLMVLTVGTVLYHAVLGLQVVIEDYVQADCKKFAALIAVKLGAAFLAVLMTVSILKVSIGG